MGFANWIYNKLNHNKIQERKEAKRRREVSKRIVESFDGAYESQRSDSLSVEELVEFYKNNPVKYKIDKPKKSLIKHKTQEIDEECMQREM